MQTILKMTRNEEGEKKPYGNLWHAGGTDGGVNSLLCSGEVFDEEGSVDAEGFAKCISKEVPRGGITCPNCLAIIRQIKAIKL